MCVESFDVGVLVVHGIGTQEEGTTVREFVDPVVALLDRLADDGGSTELVATPETKFVGIRPPPLHGKPSGCWLVGEAWWAEAFDAPGRSEVTRWLADASSWFVYFFVARLWARFKVGRRHVAVGLLAAALTAVAIGFAAADDVPPWLWITAAASWLAVGVMARSKPRSSAAIVAGSVLVLWPVAAVASFAMVAIWLVGMLPGSWTKKVRAFQVTLTGSVGDAYALVSSPRRERDMFDAITAATKKLLTELDKANPGALPPLVITAHSQGAALTYRLFDRDPCFRELLCGRKVTLVTHGSAILPIHVLECRRSHSGGWWTGLRGVGGLFGLLLLAFSLGRIVSGALSEWTAVTAGSAVVLSGLALAGARGDEHRTRCIDELPPTGNDRPVTDPKVSPRLDDADKTSRVGPAPGDVKAGMQRVCPSLPVPEDGELRWVDLWAPWDPVPNGPLDLRRPHVDDASPFAALPAQASHAFLPCRVANDHQPWLDHTTYRTNHEDVVTRWIGEIVLRSTGIPPSETELTDGRTAPATRKRRLQLGQVLLVFQGLTLLAAVAAAIARWDEIDDLGRWTLRTFPSPLRTAVEAVAAAIPETIRGALLGTSHDPARLYGFLTAAAATLVIIAVPTVSAAAWRQSESRRLHTDGDWPLRVSAAWAAVTILLFVAASVVAAAVAVDEGDDDGSVTVTAIVSLNADPSHAEPNVPVHGTVTFQPVGGDAEDAVVVDTDDKGLASAHLDPVLRYVISAEADGGKDCAVTDPDATTVQIVCEPEGGVRKPR